MSGLVPDFSSDSDSSTSSARRRRRPRLPPSPASPQQPDGAAAAAAAPAGDEDDVGVGLGDEEEEMRRMRQSSGYARFAEMRAREGAAAAERERRHGLADGGGAERHDAGGGGGDGVSGGGNGADGSSDDGDGDVGAMGPALPPGVQAHVASSGVQATAAVEVVEARIATAIPAAASEARPRRAIDPKIIDDSSDDDLGSGDSDGDAGVANLGPRAPPPPPPAGPSAAARAQAQSSVSLLPLSHEASLGSKHTAYVSALSLDPSGTRFLTASVDATLQLWDYGSMNSSLRSFRSVEPMGGGPVASACFSRSGGRILVAGALSVARVLDRDGRELVESVPGDMYIVDMARTRGHVANLSAACWMTDDRFATVAGDGTLRTWDVAAATAPKSVFDGDLPRAKQVKMVKLRTGGSGRKANASAVTFLKTSGQRIAVGCDDRSIKIIDPKAFSLKPAAENPNAVSPGAEFTSLDFGGDSGASASLLLARSTDDALRVFDVRRLGKAVTEFTDLPNEAAQTGTAFMGEGGSFFATGTSANRRGGTKCARLVVYDTKKLEVAWESAVEQERGSVIAVAWHERINQFMYGCADGSVHTMYHPESSRAGVLQCLLKQVPRKVRHGFADVGVGEIYTPATLAELTANRKRPAASSVPPKDTTVPDAAKLSSTFTKAFMKSKIKTNWTEDAQEALLKYHKPSDDAQPKILAELTAEQEEEIEMNALKARNRSGTKRTRTD